MTHIGLICPGSPGHLNPMTTLGHELKQRGHEVTLIGAWDSKPKADAAGIDFQPIAQAEMPPGSTSDMLAQLGTLSGLAAVRYTIRLITNATHLVLRDTPAIVRREGIELLLVDQATPGGETVAEHVGIPFVTVCNALMFNQEVGVPPFNTSWAYRPDLLGMLRNWLGYRALEAIANPLRSVVADYRKNWNLPQFQTTHQLFSDLAQISQQVEAFEFPRQELPSTFHFTGPFSNPLSREPVPFPWEKVGDRPLIYASMGTLQNQLIQVFEAIAEACQSLEVQLVIALGRKGALEDFPTLPGHALVVDYAPQLELLQRASLTITHAGLNTVMESLRYGVPMVAIPITNDQPGVAARLTWSGAGDVVPLGQVNGDRLRQAIQTVLQQPQYRHKAQHLQRAIHAAGGVQAAADIVEQVAKTGQPVPRRTSPTFN